MSKIEINNIYKIFGSEPSKVLPMVQNGASKENALPLAVGIIDAENQGIKSHGFHYLPIYCLHLKIQVNKFNFYL